MSTTQQPQFTVTVSLTEEAAQKVRAFMEQEGVSPEQGGLRAEVRPGGCSGFSYFLNIEEDALEDDIVTESQGIRVYVDPFSAQYLNGVTIGFHTSMMGEGFTFDNPNATGGCGCGSSFSA